MARQGVDPAVFVGTDKPADEGCIRPIGPAISPAFYLVRLHQSQSVPISPTPGIYQSRSPPSMEGTEGLIPSPRNSNNSSGNY